MRNALIDEVVNYGLDAAFVSAPIHIASLDQIKMREEQLVILTASKRLPLTDLLTEQPFKIVVFGEGCIFRARLESLD